MNDLSPLSLSYGPKVDGYTEELQKLYGPLLFIFPCLQSGRFYSKLYKVLITTFCAKENGAKTAPTLIRKYQSQRQ